MYNIFQAEIKKIGNSKGIIIPKNIISSVKIITGKKYIIIIEEEK